MLAEEVKLRQIIRQAIKYKITKDKQERLSEEQKLRKIVRQLIISEAKEIDSDKNPAPYGSTALTALADGFNEILKTVKDGLRGLQTPEERLSYRMNMLEKFKNFFKKAEAFDLKIAGVVEEDMLGESDVNEQELNISLELDDPARVMPPDGSEDHRFKPKEKSEEEKAVEVFEQERIPGLDATGAIWAFDTWNNSNIETVLSDKRQLLPKDEYKEEFKEYALFNIDLWMITYEKDLSGEKGQEPAFSEPVMDRPAGAEISPIVSSDLSTKI